MELEFKIEFIENSHYAPIYFTMQARDVNFMGCISSINWQKMPKNAWERQAKSG